MVTTQPHTTPCEISTWLRNQKGYAARSKRIGKKVTKVYAHRLAWETANGPIPEGMTVHHLCGVKPCVNPLHLELRSVSENATIGRPCPERNCICVCHRT